MTKDLKKFLKPYLKDGWSLETGLHYKLIAPNGKLVVISKTSSCPFYLKHLEGDIRRILKEMENV